MSLTDIFKEWAFAPIDPKKRSSACRRFGFVGKSLQYFLLWSFAFHYLQMCETSYAAQNRPFGSPGSEIPRAIPVPQKSGEGTRGGPATPPSITDVTPRQSAMVERSSRAKPVSAASEISRGDTSVPKTSLPNTMEGLNDKRQVMIGDRIGFNIVEDETPPRSLSVTDSGEIDVPYIGRVAVGNKTCKQLAYYVKTLLEKEYYYQATVLIGLDVAGGRSVSRGRFYINGQVLRPGPYEIPMDEVLTVSKAIFRAGGFSQYANKKKIRLMRAAPGKEKMDTLVLDMVEVMEKGQSRKDVEVVPEDLIFVDEKFFNF